MYHHDEVCKSKLHTAVNYRPFLTALNVIVGHPVALCHWPHWAALMQHCVARGAYLGGGAEYLPRVTGGGGGGGGGELRPTGTAGTEKEGEGEEEGEEGLEGDGEEGGWGDGDLAAAIGKIAELSLLGGGGGGGMFEDDDDAMMASAFSDEQVWRVAL